MINKISKRRIIIKIISLIVVACFYASTISWAMPDFSSRLNAQNIQIQSMFRPIVGDASWDYLTQLNSEKEFVLRMVAGDMPFTDINIALDEWVLSDKNPKDSRVLNVVASQRTKDGELLIFLEIINGRDKGINFVLAVPQKGINAIKQGKTSYNHRVLVCNIPVSGMVDGFSIQEMLPREYKEFPREPVATMFRGNEAVVESISPKFEDLQKIFKRMAEVKTEDDGDYNPPTLYLPMIGFDADATSEQGHVVFTSLDIGIFSEEVFNAVTRAEVNGLVQVERLVDTSHFYKAAVATGIDPKEYMFNVFIGNVLLIVFEKKTYDTIQSISGDQGDPDIPAGSLMGKFLESEIDPIRVEDGSLRGTIMSVKTGRTIEFSKENSRRAPPEDIESGTIMVEELIDTISDGDGRKALLGEVLRLFKANLPENIFLTNQGKNGFFGIGRPGLFVLDEDDDILKNPVALLHEVLEYSKYFDDTLISRIRNMLVSEQLIDSWIQTKVQKYIYEIHKNIPDKNIREILSHYIIRAFTYQLFPEADKALEYSILEKQSPDGHTYVQEVDLVDLPEKLPLSQEYRLTGADIPPSEIIRIIQEKQLNLRVKASDIFGFKCRILEMQISEFSNTLAERILSNPIFEETNLDVKEDLAIHLPLVIGELISNAYTHGNKLDLDLEVGVRWSLANGRLYVEVEDCNIIVSADPEKWETAKKMGLHGEGKGLNMINEAWGFDAPRPVYRADKKVYVTSIEIPLKDVAEGEKVQPLHTDVELAEEGAKAFLELLSKLEEKDRESAFRKFGIVYAGTAPEVTVLPRNFEDLEKLIAFVEEAPNFIYVEYKDKRFGSVINVAAATRVIETNSEIFPEEAIADPARWMKDHPGRWSSWPWADDFGREEAQVTKHMRHGLLSGFPLRSVKSGEHHMVKLIHKEVFDNAEGEMSEEERILVETNSSLGGRYPIVRKQVAELLRDKASNIFSVEEISAVENGRAVDSAAFFPFYAYSRSDMLWVQQNEKIFAHFINMLWDIPEVDTVRGEISVTPNLALDELKTISEEYVSPQHIFEYMVERRDSLIVDELTGNIVVITPLEDMMSALTDLDV